MKFIAPRVTECLLSEGRLICRELEKGRETKLCIFQRGVGREAENITSQQES